MDMNPFSWETAVAKLSPEQVAELSARRGYRPEFVQWFSDQGWIGWSPYRGGRWCFPVHEGGRIVAAHQIPPTKGEPVSYFPKGRGVHPLIVGDLATASRVYVFESQWDMMAALDAANFHREPKGAYLATRGAANRLPESLPIPKGRTLFAIMQNDPVKNGKVPAEDWLRGLMEQRSWFVLRVNTPTEYEDPQAWLAGAGLDSFREGLREAVKRALTESESAKGANTEKPDKLKNPSSGEVSEGKSGISVSPTVAGDESERERTPFPADLLPAIAQRWVSGFVKMTEGRMPLALPGICCLGTLSASIGPGVRIRSTAAGDTTGANLYLLAAAESSSGKSIPFKRITRPFFAMESELRESFKKETYPRLKAEAEELEQEKKRLLKKPNRDAEDREHLVRIEARLIELQSLMESPRLFCGDSTSQALIRLMARQQGTCLSSLSDDARTIMEIIEGKHNKGNNADDAFFIQAWTGNPFAYDRVTDRENLVISAPWLSALWFVQPDKLASLAGNAETFQSGFFQRLLVCNTGASPLPLTEHADCFPAALQSEWESLIRRLIESHRRREEPEPLLVQPSREAETLLRDFQNACVERQSAELSDVPTIAGKWGENAWRASLVLHVADHPENPAALPLSRETAERGRALVEWFAEESLRLVAPAREEKENERAAKLREILSRPKYDPETHPEGVSQGTLSNNHGFTREELESLCETYPRLFDRVEKGTTGKGGKPTFFVRVRGRA
jgi:replicative DNA helicase